MNYGEINFNGLKKINKSQKYMVLPIGAIEVHGPNLPFATDCYIAEAFAYELGKKINSISLPLVYYSFAGTTKKISGTINIPTDIIEDYLYHIIKSLVLLNFRKIIIINIHKDNDIIIKNSINKIFEKYRVPIIYINPFRDFKRFDKEIFNVNEGSYKETCLILASLHILKKQIKINQDESQNDKKDDKEDFIKNLLDIGYVKYEYENEMQHIPPVKKASYKEGIIYIEKAINEVFKNIKYLNDYINYLKKFPSDEI